MFDSCGANLACTGEAEAYDSGVSLRGLDRPDRAAERSAYIAEVYAAHERALRSFLSRFLRNDDDIADTIQDVFTRVAHLTDPSKLDLNPRAYLFRIAKHLVVDRIRHNKSHLFELHGSIDDIDLECPAPAVDDQVHWRQALTEIVARLAIAGPRVAHVVELSCLHDLTHPEIARQLGVTTRTVERCMQRARFACEALFTNT